VGWIVLPVAVFLLARWAVAPAAALADGSPLDGSMNSSARLTRGHRVRTAIAASAAVTFEVFAGLFIGTIVLIITRASFGLVNIIAAVVMAVFTPYLAILIAMYHGDLAVRRDEDATALVSAT
jgi:hypothetical protein